MALELLHTRQGEQLTMKRYLSAFLLSTALLVPQIVKGDDDHHQKRYYDRDARDWHEWNEREDRAYRRFLEERHREYRHFAKASRRERQEYWKWRHRHLEFDVR
jgi:type III secretory pathway component EscR